MKYFSQLKQYIVGVNQELRKVNWPNQTDIRRHTMLVVALSLAMAVFFFAVDYILTIILETIIK